MKSLLTIMCTVVGLENFVYRTISKYNLELNIQ